MGSRRAYGLLQRLVNQFNQTITASDDWLSSESLYTKIYLDLIDRHLSAKSPPLTIIDGGCGTGVMSIELAQNGHRVTGIEIHKSSIEVLHRSAERAGVSVETLQGDLLDRLREMPTNHFDAALCMGVLYTCASFREIVAEIGRILRTDGLFFASFRTLHYFITTLLRQGQYDKAIAISKSTEGMLRISQTPAYYNWQTDDEVADLYNDCGFDVIEQRPVGLYGGAGYDGMAAVVDVDEIDDVQRAAIYELEISTGDVRGAGRFSFAVGRKR